MIRTNNHLRDIVYGFELDRYMTSDKLEELQSDYDWLDSFDDAEFFQYKGQWYAIEDFMSTTNPFHCTLPTDHEIRQWDGYQTDSYFSATVIRYPREDWDNKTLDTEHIVVGLYLA